MSDVLLKANLELAEIDAVPQSTMYGLEARGIISDEWRGSGQRHSTSGGAFPVMKKVGLTAFGLRVALELQGFHDDA